jgi:hypothetical protein
MSHAARPGSRLPATTRSWPQPRVPIVLALTLAIAGTIRPGAEFTGLRHHHRPEEPFPEGGLPSDPLDD